MSYATHFSTLKTPQSEPIPGKQMAQNNAGGFAFALDDWARLDRFLILGNEGGSYYCSEKAMTIDNAKVVLRCVAENPNRTVNRIVEISESGRAPKNDPAIFALAICAGQKIDVKNALPRVCRIGTFLFTFVEAVEKFRGWGRNLKRAVGNWYISKEPEALARMVVKYQQRNGWSNRDVLRLCHVKPSDGDMATVINWCVKGWPSVNP